MPLGGPIPGEGIAVDARRIALVGFECERLRLRGDGAHQAVPSDLGQDRGRRDRQARHITFHDRSRPATSDEVHRSIHEHPIWNDTELVDRATRRKSERRAHPELVAL